MKLRVRRYSGVIWLLVLAILVGEISSNAVMAMIEGRTAPTPQTFISGMTVGLFLAVAGLMAYLRRFAGRVANTAAKGHYDRLRMHANLLETDESSVGWASVTRLEDGTDTLVIRGEAVPCEAMIAGLRQAADVLEANHRNHLEQELREKSKLN